MNIILSQQKRCCKTDFHWARTKYLKRDFNLDATNSPFQINCLHRPFYNVNTSSFITLWVTRKLCMYEIGLFHCAWTFSHPSLVFRYQDRWRWSSSDLLYPKTQTSYRRTHVKNKISLPSDSAINFRKCYLSSNKNLAINFRNAWLSWSKHSIHYKGHLPECREVVEIYQNTSNVG